MFNRPERFAWPESDAVQLVQDLRFGLLVSDYDGELCFSYLPFLVDVEDGRIVRLRGHFARNNPHWKALQSNPQATVVFNGPNAYVSAQWYTKECPAAPSWNFVVVHVVGNIVLHDTPEETWAILLDLIEVNESSLPQQWRVENYDPARRERLLPHILGFSLEVSRIEPKFKLNQHYAADDQLGAAKGLEADVGTDNAREIARLMRLSVERSAREGTRESGVDVTTYLDNGKTST